MTAKIAEIRKSYVDGRFVDGEGAPLQVENPATEEIVAETETLSVAQMEAAVLAARRAFDNGDWSRLRREERVEKVLALGEYLSGRSDELGATLVAEAGSTQSMLGAQVGMPLSHIRAACDLYLTLPETEHTPRPIGEVVGGNRVAASLMRWEPIGVVTAIAAYNFPLQTTIWKFVPALLTGSTVILRPSPLTPIATLVLGEAADAVGLPPGVLNVVVEGGVEGGELLTSHPAVDCVSFTGSTTVGKAIMAQASQTLKRVVLELGGKSVQLYLPDAVERAPMGCAGVFAAHSGQACVAPTRMLVPEEHKAEVVEKAAGVAGMLKVGDPTDPSTMLGPLISAAQRERNERYVAAAVEAGATIVAGGKRPEGLERGYYFEPTVLDVPDNSNPAAQDEIFGPVICVLGYRDLDHAVEIANDSVYGLAGQVYGNDLATAVGIAERIRAGAVSVNGGTGGAYASSGGYKQSGLGRERGIEGFRSLQQVKHLSVGNPRVTAVSDPSVNVFDGVRVVEFAQFVFVPSAGALLADWGADVIKIEHPVTGDGYRGLATQGIVQTSATGVNQNMEMHNRGKRSIGLDASKPEGRELLLKLVESADVFLTNFLPSALQRWNLDVDDLRARNPRIIYVRGHGHGVRGPDADMPAYDSTAYWSRGGLAETLKPPGLEHPLGPRGGFGDRLGGVNLAFGIAGALYRRERTGEPSVVDVSLLATAVWTIASDMLSALQGNWRQAPAAGASAGRPQAQLNRNPLGGSYRTKDGRDLGLMLLQPDRHWPELARALGREDLLADPRFVDAAAIFGHAPEMVEILSALFASKTLAEWRDAFLGARFPWAPNALVPEVLEDPQVVANGYIADIEHPGGDFRVPAGAVQFDEQPARLSRGPEHAEHTELVLLELGYGWDDIAKFKEAGVIT